jgi:hypothetical protein
MAVQEQTTQSIREYRIERYRDLRFSQKEAEELADTLDANGFPLDWHRVRRAIENGLGHKRAVWIFSRED